MQETEGNITDKNEKAKEALDSMKKHTGELRKAIRYFIQQKLHCALGYKDSDSGLRKCLKEKLEDESLYSTLCRWLQAFHVERTLKLEENVWPLTVLLAFYKYEENGWKKIYEKLPESNMEGFYTSMRVLDRGRIHIAALSVGIAERLIKDAVQYAVERKQFGKPIAEHQMVQSMMADCKTEAYAARAMVMDASVRRDDGENITTEAACCKYYATEMVGRVADRAVQIHGGAGYMAEYAVERFYRDVRLLRLYEGTSQIQQMVIARDMIKNADG